MALLIEQRNAFWTRMDRNYRYRYERLCAHPHFETIDLSAAGAWRPRSRGLPRGAKRQGALLVGVFAALPDAPNLHATEALSTYLEGFSARCVMLEDMHPKPHENLHAHLNDTYTHVLATYDCAQLAAIRGSCSNIRKIYVLPHHVDTVLYRDRHLPKVYDVLLYGNVDPSTYPFRHRLRDLLRRSPFRVKILDDPGSETFDPARCGESLARIINQSWISIATPSNHDYLVAKYFEISACGSVLAAKMATQGAAIWGDAYLPLNDDMSDDEIQQRIKRALKYKDTLQTMSRLAGERIRRDYSTELYADKVAAVMAEVEMDTNSCALTA